MREVERRKCEHKVLHKIDVLCKAEIDAGTYLHLLEQKNDYTSTVEYLLRFRELMYAISLVQY